MHRRELRQYHEDTDNATRQAIAAVTALHRAMPPARQGPAGDLGLEQAAPNMPRQAAPVLGVTPRGGRGRDEAEARSAGGREDADPTAPPRSHLIDAEATGQQGAVVAAVHQAQAAPDVPRRTTSGAVVTPREGQGHSGGADGAVTRAGGGPGDGGAPTDRHQPPAGAKAAADPEDGVRRDQEVRNPGQEETAGRVRGRQEGGDRGDTPAGMAPPPARRQEPPPRYAR